MSNGINMYGIYYQKSDGERIRHYPSNIDFLENLEQRRPKKRIVNLKRAGEQLLGANEIQSFPWEF